MGQLCFLFICLAMVVKLSNSQIPCCGVKIVTGQGVFDDKYTLVKEGLEKPEDVCEDGCIYKRDSSQVDEYCFRFQDTSGAVMCEGIQPTTSGDIGGTTESLEQLETQKAQVEEEQRVAEEELDTDLAEEATLSDAEAKVNETEAFVDRLTADPTQAPSNNGMKRQAATSCTEIAVLIDTMKEAVEKGDILGMVNAAVRIMTSGITGCSATEKDILVKKKSKIRDCNGRVRERIVSIKIKIKKKREKIKQLKEKKEGILLEISKRPTRPLKPNKPSDGITKPNKPASGMTKPNKPTVGFTKSDKPIFGGTKPSKPTSGMAESKPPNKPSSGIAKPTSGITKPNKPTDDFTKPDKPTSGGTKPSKSASGMTESKPTSKPSLGISNPTSGMTMANNPMSDFTKPYKPTSRETKPSNPASDITKPNRPTPGITNTNKPESEPTEQTSDKPKTNNPTSGITSPNNPSSGITEPKPVVSTLNQNTASSVSAEDKSTTVSLDDLENQKSQIEEEERAAEAELETDKAEEATLTDSEAKINETSAFIDRLTADSNPSRIRGEKRQAATSCVEIAELIDTMKEAVERGDILGMVKAAIRILTSGITGCSAAEKDIIVQRKQKITDCKGRVRERIVKIKIRIKERQIKIKQIKEKKQGILNAISKRPTRPPKPDKPDPVESTPIAFGSKPTKPSGNLPIESTPIAFGSKPTKPSGNLPVESTPIAFGLKPSIPSGNHPSESTPIAFGSKPTKPSGNLPVESTPIAFGSKPSKPPGNLPIEITPVPFGSKPTGNIPIESTPIAFGSTPNTPTNGMTKPSLNNQEESSPIAFGSKPSKPSAGITKPNNGGSEESSPVAFGSKTSKPGSIIESTPIAFGSKPTEMAKPEVPTNKQFCGKWDDHTMCKYPGPSADCAAKTTGKAFTAAGKKLILEKHNELRRKVAKGEEKDNQQQPKASNMREMVWNDELAAVAQRWADQCEFGHDKNRKKLDGTYVGQNAYMASSSRESNLDEIMLKMDKATLAWYNEVVKPGFDPASIKPFKFDYGAGHYTQVVWAESEELGCGQVMFKDGSWYKNIVVCNYAKGGNMGGAAMYEVGDPCTNCPSGYSCKDSLCAKNPAS